MLLDFFRLILLIIIIILEDVMNVLLMLLECLFNFFLLLLNEKSIGRFRFLFVVFSRFLNLEHVDRCSSAVYFQAACAAQKQSNDKLLH